MVLGNVAYLAPSAPQWLWTEISTMCVLRRVLGNDSPFGWCDFVTHNEPSGPVAEFCDHFGAVVRLRRIERRYEVACLRTGAINRTADLKRAAALVRARWNAPLHTLPRPLGQAG
jgi:hypothetical protein